MHISGFDISHHNKVFNFERMAALSHKFCFVKATQGVSFVDPQFSRNWQEGPRNGILTGAYHFFEPSKDVEAQAHHFLATVGKPRIGDLPCVLDWEQSDGIRIGTQKARALEWLKIVESETGRAPILYSYRAYLYELGDMSAFSKNPLWMAVYNPKIVSPKAPPSWPTYTFWQFSDDGGLDLNYFNGNLVELRALAGVT